MENEVVVFSDLHLEVKSKLEKEFLLKIINNKIEEIKTKGKNPVVVLAGDIDNGDKAINWMSKLNAEVIYTCGNHEFWNNDFDDVINKLSNVKEKKIHFLYNDIAVINDTIFVGSTMWTDVGESLNPDILPHALNRMNDNFYISYKSWYEKESNIKLIEKNYPYHKDTFIKDKNWNVFAEREENRKAMSFFEAFNIIYNYIDSGLNKTLKSNDYNYSTTYGGWKIDKLTYDINNNNLLLFKENKNLSFKEYYDLNANLFSQEHRDSQLIIPDNVQWEHLNLVFEKIKHLNLKSYKVIFVSHHLPFFEELLIGNDEQPGVQKNIINDINEKMFKIHKGTNYPHHNYFWRISKGDFQKQEDITAIAHYCNNGSELLPFDLFKKVNVWIHGHEHHYSFADNLKTIRVVCNPLGYGLAPFDFKENGISLSSKYLSYNKISNEEMDNELNKVSNGLLRTFICPIKDKDRIYKESSLYILGNSDLDNYSSKLTKCLNLNKKLMSIFIKWQHLQNKELKKAQNDKIQLLLDSISYNVNIILEEDIKFLKALNVRIKEDYSYLNDFINLSTRYTLFPPSHDSLSIFDNYSGTNREYWIKLAYHNIEFLKQRNKFISLIKKKVNKVRNYDDISTNLINDCEKIFNKFKKVKVFTEGNKFFNFEKKNFTKKPQVEIDDDF